MTFPSSGTLERLKARDESAMPDELHLLTADTDTDALGHTYETGTYTTASTVACRWRELTGREAEIARALAPDVTHNVWCPVGTTVSLNQRIEVYQSGTLSMTARVLWVITGSYPTSIKLLCQELTT